MRAPLVFVSHGSPMIAIADDAYTRALRALGTSRQRPPAILVVSAHWQLPALAVTGSVNPETIHDFGGFPDELYQIYYSCPGQPMLAHRIAARLGAKVDRQRGLDHGVWVPLSHIFPDARVPVIQLSLPAGATPGALIDLGRQLAFLRSEGFWIMGTGGIVHNLGRLVRPGSSGGNGSPTPDWARAFDDWVAERVVTLDLPSLTEYRRDAPYANLAVPTSEHLDPLFVVLGAVLPGDKVRPVHQGFELGTISLRSFVISEDDLGVDRPTPRR